MYSQIKIAALSLIATTTAAQENNTLYKNYIEAGINSGVYSSSFTGGVQGAFGRHFIPAGKKTAIDFRAKENYTHKPNRQAGLLSLTFRYFLTRKFYLGAGFAHNHEISFHNYLDEPVRATMGNSKNLIHRTGIILETGYDFKQLNRKGNFGISPVVNFAVNYMLLDKEPNPFVTISLGFRYGFKPLQNFENRKIKYR